MKQHLRTWLGLAIGLVAGYFAFRNVDLPALVTGLADTNLYYLVPAVAAGICTFLLRAVRWRQLVGAGAGLSFRPAFRILSVSYFANNVLPARLGDALRAFQASRASHRPIAFYLTTLLVERILDGLTLVLFLFGALATASGLQSTALAVRVGYFAAAAFVAVAVGAALVVALRHWAMALVVRLIPAARRLEPIVEDVASGMLAGGAGGLARAAATSMAVWTLEAAVYWIVGTACGLPLPVPAWILTMAVLNLGTVIPSAPGFAGTFEYLAVGTFDLFGLPPTVALSYALVLRLVQFVPITVIGLVNYLRSELPSPRLTEQEATQQ